MAQMFKTLQKDDWFVFVDKVYNGESYQKIDDNTALSIYGEFITVRNKLCESLMCGELPNINALRIKVKAKAS